MTDLTYRDAIYGNAIVQYLEYFKKNNMKFNIFVSLENTNIPELPPQAFLNGFLFCSFDYCNGKDLKGKSYNLNNFTTDLFPDIFSLKSDDMTLADYLHLKASFRTFSPSMLAIYTDGTGIFTAEGKLKANDPEIIGEFVCLLSIDQLNYKAEKDFNAAMWEWKCKRNESRSAMEAEFGVDLKNLSHLWRLMTKSKEILTTGDYNPTLYGEELKTLRGIRDGSLYGKDSYEFAIKFAEENDNELNELYKTTKLPKKADMVGINNLVLKLQGLI